MTTEPTQTHRRTKDEVVAYILSLKPRERVQETEKSSALYGRQGTVYLGSTDQICILWDKHKGEEGQMGTSATEGARRVSEMVHERDLALSTQRIAELESRVKQVEELASLWSEYADFLYKANEGPITMAHAHGWRCSVDDVEKGREYRAKIAALSPSPPAVENEGIPLPVATIDPRTGDVVDDAPVEVERWAKERAHFAKGGRIQYDSGIGWTDWTPETAPHFTGSTWEWRIHPDDDAPPVQTEEKA